MMLRPSMYQIISKNESYYSLVIGVAKRAREIAEAHVKEKEAAKARRKEENLEKKQRQMLSTIGQLTLERDFLQDAFRRTGRPVPRFNPEDE